MAIVDDSVQLAQCDDTVDEWRYHQSGDFSGLVLGALNEFMACWDTGKGWDGPYKADGKKLRKKAFEAAPAELGCGWSKVPA